MTEHFSLDELTFSDYAIRHGIDNTPTEPEVMLNLHTLALGLEECRAHLGKAIVVTSGYRSPEVNAAVGGSKRSAHMSGLAADIQVPGTSPRAVCLALVDSGIRFERLIYEGGWTHIAFAPTGVRARQKVMTAHFKDGKATYTKGIV